MSKTILPIILLALTTISGLYYSFDGKNTEQELFNSLRQQFSVTFDESELVYRFNIFKDNLKKIQEHNAKLSKGHEEGLNQFIFLTHDEFVAQYLSKFESPVQNVEVKDTPINGPIVDWVTYGAVSPVKSQGACGATYAFSAIGAIEGVSVIFFKTQQ